MSALTELQNLVLREAAHGTLITKGATLTYEELDGNFIKLYEALSDFFDPLNMEPYDDGKEYEAGSDDPSKKYVYYEGKAWEAIYEEEGEPVAFQGFTPEEGLYWQTRSVINILPSPVDLIKGPKTFTIEADLTEGENTITHSLGKKARIVVFMEGGQKSDFLWERDSTDELNTIKVYASEDITGIEINIMAY